MLRLVMQGTVAEEASSAVVNAVRQAYLKANPTLTPGGLEIVFKAINTEKIDSNG